MKVQARCIFSEEPWHRNGYCEYCPALVVTCRTPTCLNDLETPTEIERGFCRRCDETAERRDAA